MILPSLLGASVFAYSGYMLLQLQHLGVVGAYTWIPLGFWAIDQSAEAGDWRSLWKLVAASALAFLAGYTPSWFVFCICMIAYAAGGRRRWMVAVWSALALAASLLLVMTQLLPATEAAGLKALELNYGTGIRSLEFYLSYFIPNYFDWGMHAPPHRGGEYLYLGAPALFGLVWTLRRRLARGQVPLLAVAGVALVLLTNPFGLVWALVRHSRWLSQICRDWYFLAAITPAVAGLAAAGLDDFLRGKGRAVPRSLVVVALISLVCWSARQVSIWLPGGREFAAGYRGVLEPAVMLALFSFAIWTLRGQKGGLCISLAAVLLAAVATDYKVFGTSKRFNAQPGAWDDQHPEGVLPGVDDAVYRLLRANSEYHVVSDITGPRGPELRHYGLTTPQGDDPFLPDHYRSTIAPFADFATGRTFLLDPGHTKAMCELGVRYFITSEGARRFEQLMAHPNYRLLEPSGSFYKVFELSTPCLPYCFEVATRESAGWIRRVSAAPEKRDFIVSSPAGGRFVLAEELFPGWRVSIDGTPAPLAPWREAFQSVQVPPGLHRLEFTFRSVSLRAGAIVSVASLLGLWLLFRRPLPTSRPAASASLRLT